MNNTQKIIELLEKTVMSSSNLPFTGKVLLNREKIYSLIEELRESLPQEFNQAKRIVSEKQIVLEDTQKEASKILDIAKSEASRLIEESTITKAAQIKAEEIVKQGEEEVKRHAISVLNQLKGIVEKLLSEIEKEKSKLEQNL
ncbi:MAG: hypothetical protein DDT40_00157 [candidate division WS2 bacterium]|uniref:ATPase n=1 Tax=Psychracetigena formicireducens TaxID=2986056 RepID=A0A9E2BH32_PSYF1|nr:hypothetical protein [Candidatus Psychracetigena formicireducens]MBT9144471.1 hypothetical protein [Candidatus Psychracetigena formicireducens]MBT9149991.1 hypothetical protein [Candidatus Psychracetigena formicireducens]